MEITRPTVMEVNLNNFKFNINQIQKLIGNNVKIMPVVKSNAYGTYINTRIDILNDFDIIAVALVDEAIELRKYGYDKEIFVLNQPYIDEIDKIVEYNVTVGVSEENFIRKIGNSKSKINVHLEIDTGMGRTGIIKDKITNILEMLESYSNIKVQGIYTHLSSADYDFEYTRKQLKLFDEAVNIITSKFKDIKYIHTSASNGILNFPNKYNLVRPGMILYGYPSYNECKEIINLKPVSKLKSKITFLKEVPENTSIGYSRKFVTNKKAKIATIPIGYADGLRRNLSNKGEVLINGYKTKIIGNICMDSFMADVTNVDNVKVGDDVYIWDNENITLEDVAQLCETINYDIISTISNRVPRIFIK